MKPMIPAERIARSLLLLLVIVLGMGAVPCSLRISGLPGSSEKEGREGTMDIHAVDHELVQPTDPQSGAATAVRQHRPLTLLKEIDRASPGLHAALVSGRVFRDATLEFYRIDPATRRETKYYTLTLTGVRVVGLKTLVPTTLLPENAPYGHMEEVRVVYERIEWAWLPDGIVEADTWMARPASESALTDSKSSGAARK